MKCRSCVGHAIALLTICVCKTWDRMSKDSIFEYICLKTTTITSLQLITLFGGWGGRIKRRKRKGVRAGKGKSHEGKAALTIPCYKVMIDGY